MKSIHIIPNEKFTKNFINKINANFGEENHFFLVIRSEHYEDIETVKNVEMVESSAKTVWKILKTMLRYDKIFLHNISYYYIHPYLLLLLAYVPKKIKKQYWVIWGMDLYCYEEKKESGKEKIAEWIRRIFIRNLYGIIFWVKGDYELACKWYGTKAKFFPGGYWDEKTEFLESVFATGVQKKDKLIRIQVGNSAALRNRHIEALRKLKQIDSENIIIYCPLSYAGDEEYIQKVIEEGKVLFGERFNPITEMMSKNKYIEYLNTIDIGIFNTDRQMGLGNITLLAALGKKVYINDYTTSWGYYEECDIEIFAFNTLDFTNEKDKDEFFKPLNEKQKQDNFDRVINNKKAAKQLWENIFES